MCRNKLKQSRRCVGSTTMQYYYMYYYYYYYYYYYATFSEDPIRSF